MNSRILAHILVLACAAAQAQTPASAPYTPSWQARHHLQLLVDHAGLALPLTHWPLPAAAVEQALADLPAALGNTGVDLEGARQSVLRELGSRRTHASLRLQLRNSAEGLTGSTPRMAVYQLLARPIWSVRLRGSYQPATPT